MAGRGLGSDSKKTTHIVIINRERKTKLDCKTFYTVASKVSFKAKSIDKPYDLWYIPEEPGFNTGSKQTLGASSVCGTFFFFFLLLCLTKCLNVKAFSAKEC